VAGSKAETPGAKPHPEEVEVVEVVLGSKNHPEEEDELFGLRKMMRILGDEEQHNEKLVHALNVLLGMSVVETSLERMFERGTLSCVYHMLQHFDQLAHFFKLEHHTPDNHTLAGGSHGQKAPRLDDALDAVHLELAKAKEVFSRRRPPLFPQLGPLENVATKDEAFFRNLDDTQLRMLPRLPSFVSHISNGTRYKPSPLYSNSLCPVAVLLSLI
jgi:hypothetical protein